MLCVLKQGELMILIPSVHNLLSAEDTTTNDNSPVLSVPAQLMKQFFHSKLFLPISYYQWIPTLVQDLTLQVTIPQ